MPKVDSKTVRTTGDEQSDHYGYRAIGSGALNRDYLDDLSSCGWHEPCENSL